MKLFNKKVKDDLLEEEVVQESKVKSLLKNTKFLVACGVVVILILIMILKSVLGGDKTNIEYFDTLESIFSSELGYYKYTLDVRTGEKGTLLSSSTTTTEASIDELNSVDTVEEASTEESTESTYTSKNEFQSWDKYADIKTGEWQYPNYKITIEGNTTSVDPLTTNFTVTLATSAYNAVFTEVYCIDGNYYIDLESMYNYLKNSGDSYLVEVGSQLPNGSKWLVISEDEFSSVSRLAETGETDYSSCDSLVTLYRRFLVGLDAVKSAVKSSVGTAGQTVSDNNVVSISLSGDNAVSLAKAFKSMAVQSGDFYTSLITSATNSGLYTESQYNQAVREKDNYIQAIYDVATYLQITDPSDLGVVIGGSARSYTNGYGNTQIEASLTANYSSDKDVILQFSGIRAGDNNQITLPSGSQVKGDNTVYRDVMNKVVDYLNFTGIKTDVKLEINPDTISDSILEDFITLVNETGTAGYYVTKNNVQDFIDTYANYKQTSETTNADVVNAQLVSDLADTLNNIIGGIVVEKEVETVAEVEQYPTIEIIKNGGVEFTINYNQADSNSKILVFDLDVINKTDEEYTFSTEDISIRNLLNSTYPANNETLLRNANNMFDMSLLETEITLAPHEWKTVKLYFTPDDNEGHFDLYFGDDNCGSAIEY
jgi:hypothetical protein